MGGDNGEKKRKGHQGTCIKDIRTKTMGVEDWEVEVYRAEESNRGKWGQL